MSSVLSLLASFALTFTNAWNYKDAGPNVWHEYYSACLGKYQSPINLNTKLPASCSNTTSNRLTLNWHASNIEQDFIVQNNGHTMALTPINIKSRANIIELLNTNKNRIATLPNIWFDSYKSVENKKYCLDSLHFHWGETGSVGSEHTFDGKHSALEAHFLHYSCDYESLGDALKAYNSGRVSDEYVLSAVGILFDVGEPNKAIEKMVTPDIINETYQIGGNDKNKPFKVSHILSKFNVHDLLPENKEFVTYLGSITAPPCNETVRWNVLTHKLTISEAQLSQFRKLLESDDETDKIINNYRPVQENLNRVYYCESEMDEIMLKEEKESHALAIIIIVGSVIFVFICVMGICKYNKKRKEKGYINDMVSMSTAMGEHNQELSRDKYACYT